VKDNAQEGAQSLEQVAEVVDIANKNTDKTSVIMEQLAKDAAVLVTLWKQLSKLLSKPTCWL